MALPGTALLTQPFSLLPNSPTWVEALLGIAVLALAAMAANLALTHIVLRVISRFVPCAWPVPATIGAALPHTVPALTVSAMGLFVPFFPAWGARVPPNRV